MMWMLLLLLLTVSFLLGQQQEDNIRQQSEKKTEADTFRSEGESKNVRQGNIRDGVEMRGLDG